MVNLYSDIVKMSRICIRESRCRLVNLFIMIIYTMINHDVSCQMCILRAVAIYILKLYVLKAFQSDCLIFKQRRERNEQRILKWENLS